MQNSQLAMVAVEGKAEEGCTATNQVSPFHVQKSEIIGMSSYLLLFSVVVVQRYI